MIENKWKKLKKGMGIKVKIPGDIDENGKQKIRPGIVIKNYPSHLKVQLLSTQKSSSKNNYKFTVNNKISYVRAIYHVTISFNLVTSLWFEKGKLVYIDSKSVFFQKIIEMEYNEIFESELDLSFMREKHAYQQKISELTKENKELLDKIDKITTKE